jgi:hypothetical protein
MLAPPETPEEHEEHVKERKRLRTVELPERYQALFAATKAAEDSLAELSLVVKRAASDGL